MSLKDNRSIIEEQILELEFNSVEEEKEMINCLDIYLDGGIEFLGKNSYELQEETGVESYLWTMFLVLAPVRKFIKDAVNNIAQASAKKSLLNIMNKDVKPSDVSVFKELQRMVDSTDSDNSQRIIVTRIPSKK